MTPPNTADSEELDKIITEHNVYIDAVWKGQHEMYQPPRTVEKILAWHSQKLQAAELKARLVELDLLEQQMNRWELPEAVHKELHRFKMLRLGDLTKRLAALREGK